MHKAPWLHGPDPMALQDDSSAGNMLMTSEKDDIWYRKYTRGRFALIQAQLLNLRQELIRNTMICVLWELTVHDHNGFLQASNLLIFEINTQVSQESHLFQAFSQKTC